MNDESIDRISEATKAAPAGDKIDTSNVDKTVLRKDIESVDTVHLWAKGAGPSKLQKKRNRRRDRIAKKAAELRDLLDDDRADDGAVGMFYPRTLSDYLDVTSGIVRAAERALKPLRPLIYGDKRDFERASELFLHALTSGSPFEVSIARLIFIYEKHFEDDAGSTKNAHGSSVPDGPFIRFADTALWELGITKGNGERYLYNSIATAVIHVRQGGRRNLRRAPQARRPLGHRN
jgi:hypothetical protein